MSTAAISIVSGGVGARAEYLVHMALAQFTAPGLPIVIVPGVRQIGQIAHAV